METSNFYQNHLDRVSRSFAFCIRRLDAPLRHWISVGYLVCRILDTIEDSQWASQAEQQAAFCDFDRFLAGLSKGHNDSLENIKSQQNLSLMLAEMDQWHLKFPRNVAASELELLREARRVFEDIHAFPNSLMLKFQAAVGSMSRGMQHFVFRSGGKGALKMASQKEANQYCFFVAGVVGELLTEMVGLQDSRFHATDGILCQSFHFGLFLQKLNLLKDQLDDEKLGRYLVPDRALMRQSLPLHAEKAFHYINQIPLDQKSYRLFCSWSLFLGLGSLPFMDRSYKEKSHHKISRTRTFLLIKEIEKNIDDPSALSRLFSKYMIHAKLWSANNQTLNMKEQGHIDDCQTTSMPGEAMKLINKDALEPWFQKAYVGGLSQAGSASGFVSLGVCGASL